MMFDDSFDEYDLWKRTASLIALMAPLSVAGPVVNHYGQNEIDVWLDLFLS